MRQSASLVPKLYSNERARATCAGMATTDMFHISSHESRGLSFSSLVRSFLQQCMLSLGQIETKEMQKESIISSPIQMAEGHEYISLDFAPALIAAMKNHGTSSSASSEEIEFVSTNDMLSAYSWLLKRHLSGQHEDSLSMVVDLRGRGGVAAFGTGTSSSKGVFGNALSNVFCSSIDSKEALKALPLSINAVSQAASSIRASLLHGIPQFSDRVASSRLGRPVPHGNGGKPSFATTSWSRFPFWKRIRFSYNRTSGLQGLHAFPSYPLPLGNSFSSVIVPTFTGGFTCNLLLPSGKAEEARILHRNLSRDFMTWDKDVNDSSSLKI